MQSGLNRNNVAKEQAKTVEPNYLKYNEQQHQQQQQHTLAASPER